MVLCFDRFRLDRANQRLEDAGGEVPLNPKAFQVLRVLTERSGQLVSKEQLLEAVWPDTHVVDGVLKVNIAELRKALGDSATAPRFIETVHRRGYRFVAPVTATAAADPSRATAPVRAHPVLAWPVGGVPTGPAQVGLVGRGSELEFLGACLARALEGRRQVVFVTGEAGGGKTALVEHFVTDVGRGRVVAVTGSQCLERFGSEEAYMPVLEAIGRLVREDDAARTLLRRYAPTWFAQLPWLIEEDDRERLGRELLGAARERMLREMAEFAEAFAADVPLVLVLDDLHWSDPSTVDLLALLAGRRERARILVLGTYRPAHVVLTRHPLRAVVHRLAAGGQCAEVALDDLRVDAVAEYLARRFAGSRFPAEIARLVRERTDGNPLFLATLVEHLLARGAILERDGQWHAVKELRGELAAVPESLRRLIEQQLDALQPEDRDLLRAASLVGFEFSAAAAAAGADRDPADVEERCERLAVAERLLRRAPNGSFTFRHALYRDALAAAVPARRKSDMHLRIAELIERGHAERPGDLAAELALHFEEGGDGRRAIHYRRLAAQVAANRYALAEAETHLEKGLSLLAGLPPSPERDREELGLQSMVGPVRMATRGYAAPEVEQAYTRALRLSRGATEPSIFPVLWGLWVFYAVRGELERALELAERNLVIAEASGDRLLRLEAHHGLWTTHFFRGDLAAALRHLDAGEPLYDPVADRSSALVYGQDPKMAALGYRSLVLWAMGHLDQAVALSGQAVEHALALGHPMSVGQAMVFASWVRLCRGEAAAAEEQADAVIAYCTEHALPFWMPNGLQVRGWALVEQGRTDEGMTEWRRGVEAWDALRGSLGRSPYDAFFAAALARTGRQEEARALLERCKALILATGERYHESEVNRIDAELLLGESGGADRAPAVARKRADSLLRAAVACARHQGARTLELRAATALARLCRSGASRNEARARVADLVQSFAEGLDTTDLRDARALLSAP
jgi:DNA-binding winged helix-turn-helix (wHTH) protein/predicted ATPase